MTRTQLRTRHKTRANRSHRQSAIRQAGAGDRDAIRDFFDSLSPRSRYLRFFTNASPASAAMLRALAGDGDNLDVVVAVEQGAIIGHAMAVLTNTAVTGSGIADIGVAVADSWQGRGIGSELVRMLTARAAARGATAASMDVLAENRQVLAMIARRWPGARYERCTAHVTVHTPLSAGGGHEQQRRSERSFSPKRLGDAVTRKRTQAA